jgi:hypothetical protein
MPSRRAFLADVRGDDRYFRATWHPDTSVVVLSHWIGEVCTASTPVALADVSQLIGLLVNALQEAAGRSPQQESLTVESGLTTRGLIGRILRWLRPPLAPVTAIGSQATSQDKRRAAGS